LVFFVCLEYFVVRDFSAEFENWLASMEWQEL
jgi:hypothetical protein